MTRIVINVKQKRRESGKCVGDVSCKYKLFDITTPINICSIVGSPVTFASPKGAPGAVTAENHWVSR